MQQSNMNFSALRFRMAGAVVFAISIFAVWSLMLAASQAQAHGYLESPAGRSLQCKQGLNLHCGQIQYEPQSLEAAGNYPAGGPADGEITGAGLYPELYVQSSKRWNKVPMNSGPVTFQWRLTAAHATKSWKYYITRKDWNPEKTLARADFDSEPFCTVLADGKAPSSTPAHSCQVPADRSGYHVILGVWEIADTGNAFYQALDVQLSNGGENGADRMAPSVPSGLTATGITANSVTLKWTASRDNVAVGGYELFRDGVKIQTVTGTSYMDTGVLPSTTYRYAVLAIDTSGNRSGASNELQVITSGSSPEIQAWSPMKVYYAGERVIYQLISYIAQWWTQGEQPDQSPVWKAENAPVSEWLATRIYYAKDRVMLQGIIYEAQWWTLGEKPGNAQVWKRTGDSGVPTSAPSPTSTPVMTPVPTPAPTATPIVTVKPTIRPTATPVVTVKPTTRPTATPVVTTRPTVRPTATPSVTGTPTPRVTSTPTATVMPTATPSVTGTPTPRVTSMPTATVMPTASPDGNAYKVVGYYPGWATYGRNYQVSAIDPFKLTHINYAFANIANGEVVLGDSYADTDKFFPGDCWDPGCERGNFNQLKKLKALNPKLKTLISVGGWTWSGNFSDVALTDASRSKFADSAVRFIRQWGFDGVDLDWEYPVGGGLTSGRAEDKVNFTLLLQTLRTKLDAAGRADGRSYLLTIASGASPSYVQNTELAKVAALVDWINIMTYDFHGSWEKMSGHNAGLYFDPEDPSVDARTFNVDAGVKGHLDAGVPAAKLVMGVPFYGRGWQGCPSANFGMYQVCSGGSSAGTWEAGVFDYDDLEANYINKNGYTRHWDDDAKVPYLYNPQNGVVISYDDALSIDHKINLMKVRQLGGAMFWELSGDRKHVLTDRLVSGLLK